jgi:CTP-dependent riboflavin kinase
VVRGVGKAAFFTRLDWFRRQCLRQLGFDPYPGTLNVQVVQACAAAVATLRNESGISLVPPNGQCCSARMLPVSVGGMRGAVIIPEKRVQVHDESIIEIVASMRLKGALGLADGDAVTVTVHLS